MASRWAARLPRVTVPRGVTPKALTFIYPYYENAQFLRAQWRTWHGYAADLRQHVSAIVVDDGSPTPAVLPEDPPFPVRLFRIGVDIRWNWLAARNIGAHHASDGWLLLTDMDHVVPEDTLRGLVYGQHDPGVIYVFSRREHTGEPVAPHSASFFMTKAMFWTIGGYDERLSGFYGTDGLYRRRAQAIASLQILSDALVRHEFQADSSTTRYQRKQPIDASLPAVAAACQNGSGRKTLSFPYQEVRA